MWSELSVRKKRMMFTVAIFMQLCFFKSLFFSQGAICEKHVSVLLYYQRGSANLFRWRYFQVEYSLLRFLSQSVWEDLEI